MPFCGLKHPAAPTQREHAFEPRCGPLVGQPDQSLQPYPATKSDLAYKQSEQNPNESGAERVGWSRV